MVIVLLSLETKANPTTENPIANELSTSPDDVTQLLSTLKQDNKSLIEKTPVDQFLKQIDKIKKLHKRYGLDWGMSYIPLLEHSSFSHNKENASGGAYQFFSNYRPQRFQASKTLFGLKIETNQRFTEISPGNFADELNSAILTVSGYRPYPPAITELWIQQSILPNIMAYRLGKIDLTSIMNSYAFDSRQFYFLSNVFSRHPATAVPTKALGAVLGIALGSHFYTALGTVDANGEDNAADFAVFRKGKLFTALELGYRDIITNPQSDNYHLFLWHVDAQPEKQQLSDQGLSVVLQKNLFNQFIPFVKLDWSKGRVATFNKLFITGFGLQHPFFGSIGLWGLGLGYAELAENQDHQGILETFYRIQLTPHSQLTPNIQWIKTLPFNETTPIATVFNLRYRIAV